MSAHIMYALLLVLLTGCASMSRDAGFDVQLKAATELRNRPEPWHNVTVMGDLRLVQSLAVAVVNLPDPLPPKWRAELRDPGRTYEVRQADGTLPKKTLERVVFRAGAYTEDGRFVEFFDAVLVQGRMLFVLLSPERAEDLKRYQFAILPSDASWLMTTQKELVELKGLDVRQLPPGFFAAHPSPLRQAIVIERDHAAFQGLMDMFPRHFRIRGVAYSGRPDVDVILSRFTSLDTALDKVVSCGSLAIQPGLITVGLVLSVARDITAIIQDDCLRGSDQPAKEKEP